MKTVEIALTQGKTTTIDKEDLEKVSKYKWHFNNKKEGHGYAQRSQHIRVSKNKYKTKITYLHRFVLNLTDNSLGVDHINGNTLDNRKENLRVVNQLINTRNRKSVKNSSSKFTGVHLHKQSGKWRSQIKINGKIKSLGLFSSQKEAKEARDKFIESNNLYGFRR